MSQKQLSLGQAKQQARKVATEARPGIEWLGRLGYAAKGVVYILVGVLAAQAAAGRGGETTDTQGVLVRILDAPFGRILLGLIAIGLLGHAVWRWVEATQDTENKGSDASGLITRAAYAGIGVIYAGLALTAFRLVLGQNAGSGDSTQSTTAWLLAQPFGRVLVVGTGLVIIGIGVYQFVRAYRASFQEKLRVGEMSAAQQRWAVYAGRLGYSARGVVFGIIGWFLIDAALKARPEEARGLGGALDTLSRQPYGQWLLGITAVGLAAYGIFMFVEARYRRMFLR